ncbi:MAG: hypothetical protein JO307_12035 [Bryobacterales bacterium]|nr:hypothetical protein [Bryobacterales bacterium]MBV9401412.1 hypothetical protein [Bryobacterales bacterium]
MVKLARQFLGHVLPGVMRPLRILWNEIIGFLFFVIAISATPSIIRNVRGLSQPDGSPFRVFVSVAFAAIMLYFAVTSFLRARKIGRS